MHIAKDEFTAKLHQLAGEAGIELTEKQTELCHRHVTFMLEWNLRSNLTRITDPDEILVKHILDSLIPSRWLPVKGAVLDVGTGPGFPGIPLKILRPELSMTLLETNRKKVSFLRVALAKLGMDGIQAVQGRWEELCRESGGAAPRLDLITMRAVRLEQEHLTNLAAMLLHPGGLFAWWAGPSGPDEWDPLSKGVPDKGISLFGRFEYTLPSASRPRRLLVWRKET